MAAPTRILPLVTWRLLAVLCVIVYHCGVKELGPGSWFAVELCFVMSGFLMMWHHADGIDGSYRQYAWRRAKRLFPLHWAVLAAMLLIFSLRPAFGTVPEWWVIVLNAALLQTFVPVHDVYYSINTYSWFISALMFCYLVFPLLQRLLARIRLRWQLLLLMAMAALMITLDATLNSRWREYLFVLPPVRMLDFVLGMVLFRFYRALEVLDRQNAKYKAPGTVKATVLELAVIVFIVEMCIIDWSSEVLRPYEDIILWWIPASSVVLMCARLAGHEGLVGRLFSLRWLQWLGGATLEMYLLQGVVPMLLTLTLLPLASHYGVNLDGYIIPLYVTAIVVTALAVNSLTRRKK